MKQLIIAEKPSVAGDIAKALGKFKKTEDYYENDTIIISWAIGHLVELCMPQDISPSLKSWSFKNLPILPEAFPLKPIEKTQKRLEALKRLIKKKEVTELINACDAGREGELIFTYIYMVTGCKKPFRRMWMQSMTADSIRTAFQGLRSQEEMQPLQDAARCRSESDWLIGINGTRALTNKLYTFRSGQVATVGRVQTPTLSIMVEREQAISAFVPQVYWKLQSQFQLKSGLYEGVYQKPAFKKQHEEDRVDRIWDKAAADELLIAIQKIPTGNVIDEKKRTTQVAPRLYDLTTLQREANVRFGFPAGRTSQISQALYERHKVITYPRTDAKALPEDYAGNCIQILKSLDGDLQPFAKEILKKDWVKPSNKRIFNNKEISDHFAIIPTHEKPSKLSPEEYKIYQLIASRFVAIFFPSAEFDVTTRLTHVADHTFKTEGKVLVEAGWLAVHGRDLAQKESLPAIIAADGTPAKCTVKDPELLEDITKHPARYSEATLLSAMETAGKRIEDEELAEAIREKGIGTPATRASIIEHLMYEKYIERDQRELIPSAKAQRLIEYLKAIKLDQFISPSMTGEWEFKLKQIEHNKLSRIEFMNTIKQATDAIVSKTRDFDASQANKQAIPVNAPSDGLPMFETIESYCSQDGVYVISKVVGNRKLELSELAHLLKEKTIGPLDGFRSRKGKAFSAMLKLNEESHRVEFVFEAGQEQEDDGEAPKLTAEDFNKFPCVGQCPLAKNKICGHAQANVYELPNAYVCESAALKQSGCTFKVSRTLLERIIKRDEFVKLLETGKTDLLEKFKSKRTKRFFSAHLVLKDDGGIGFEFAARPAAATKKSTASKKSFTKSVSKKTVAKK